MAEISDSADRTIFPKLVIEAYTELGVGTFSIRAYVRFSDRP
jgi:hypothetical protein